MPEENEGQKPEEEMAEDEEVQETTFSEEENSDAPDPEMLTEEEVKGILDSTKLPKASRERLVEAEYSDHELLQEAIKAEVAYVKELTGSGKPFAQGALAPPENKPRTEEEKIERFNRTMREVGLEEV